MTLLLLVAQEAERRRIARTLHDDLGQLLTYLRITLEDAKREHGAMRDAKLDEGIALTEQALQQARDVSVELWPTILDDLGLPSAVQWLADRHARSSTLEIHVDVDPIPRAAFAIETACFRVVQEALVNVKRHAAARSVELELRSVASTIEVVIRDDGQGFDVAAAWKRASGSSLGLFAMRERATFAGGGLEVESTLGRGTCVRAWFPALDECVS